MLKQLAIVYLSFTRSTPLIVQLFLIYFGLPSAFTCSRDSNQSLGSYVICDDDIFFTYGRLFI
ncbi:hypothetical protein ACEQPO_19985 [Bacillus sp. SL00103]